MAASIQRRVKRQQERDRAKIIAKIHKETMERFKTMSEEDIKKELEEFQKQYGYNNQSN
jgi:hypothetical protein